MKLLKNKFRVLFSACLLLIAFACEEELTTFEGPYHVRFTAATTSIDENASGSSEIKLHFAGPTTNQALEIQISVSGGAVDEDFTFVEGGTSLSIPSGEFFTSFKVAPIDNENFTGNRVITFTIESVTGADAGFGLVGKTFNWTIVDDDCAVPSLEGTYLVYNRDASPAACGNPANDGVLTYEATITLVSDVGGIKTYNISDVTGGLYALCYGDGENPGNITTNGFVITLDSQPDVVYGSDEFNGTGQMDCDGNFTLTWSNGFGDRATSYYTKQ